MSAQPSKKLLSAGIVAAIASSLCCIVPAIAALASISGIAASFSWIEPARPYLIAFAAITLGAAWYLQLRPVKAEAGDCACEIDARPSFWKTKKFLALITVFAILMMAFPLYSGIFYPSQEKQVIVVQESNVVTGKLIIKGMTCTGCENHITSTLNKQEGVIESKASYQEGSATVTFDKTRNTLEKIAKALQDETGYKVKSYELINKQQ